MIILGYFFLISPLKKNNICCGYSLEVSRRGTSNEYPQQMLLISFGELEKIILELLSNTPPLQLLCVYNRNNP